MPKISIVLPTYNHEPFVAQAIQSALDQTFGDFEFLIADDGSSDGTREVIATFKDPRIRYFPNTVNRGACVVTNELLAQAKGEYVTLLHSDDYWPADRLAWQAEFLDTHPEYAAAFGQVNFVYRDGNPIPLHVANPRKIFAQENRSQSQWLRWLFENSNCLPHTTLVIRRECYETLGGYDNRMRQIPDFDMWIRFLKRYAFYVTDKDLVFARVLPGQNASDGKWENYVRGRNEHFMITQKYFDGASRDLMIEGFGDILRFKNPPSAEHLEIEKALLFTRSGIFERIYLVVAYMKLFQLLGDPVYRSILLKDYNFTDLDLQKLATRVDTWIDPESTLKERQRQAEGKGHA